MRSLVGFREAQGSEELTPSVVVAEVNAQLFEFFVAHVALLRLSTNLEDFGRALPEE